MKAHPRDWELLPISSKRAGSRRNLKIFSELQREILLGIRPPKSILLELELAEEYGVSQGTVREALLLLQELGLVYRQAHRSTTVSDCKQDDAQELLRLRLGIECRGITRAFEKNLDPLIHILRERLSKMLDAAATGDEYLLSIHDRAFHMHLFEHADLPLVEPVLQRCLVHAHRYKILNHPKDRDLIETANRHAVIIEALESSDQIRSIRELSNHITTIVDFGPNLIGINEESF
jgi:DNA-binding GntR family transcriptional regulator